MSRFESDLSIEQESKQTCFEPCIVAVIEGVPFRVGSKCLKDCLRVDNPGLYLDDTISNYCLDDSEVYELCQDFDVRSLGEGLCLDAALCLDESVTTDVGCLDCIDLDKSTSKVSESVRPDRGSASAISTFTLRIVDKNCEATRLISPNGYTDDLMGKRVDVYLDTCGLTDLSTFPDAWKRIFAGYVCEICSGPGYVDIKMCHPDSLKRRSIFDKCDGLTTNAYDPSAATPSVSVQAVPTCRFLLPADGFRTVLKLGEDNYVELGPDVPNPSDGGFEFWSFVEFDTGYPIFAGGWADPNIEPATGLPWVLANPPGSGPFEWWPIDSTTGDFLINPDTGLPYYLPRNSTELGETINANIPYDISRYCDQGTEVLPAGTDVCPMYVLEGNPMDIALKMMLSCPPGRDNGSVYNVYGDGLCLNEEDVDIEAHEFIRDNVLVGTEVCFYITDTIDDVRNFIEEQLYLPFGLSSTSKNSQASVNSQVSLFPGDQSVITLNEDKIKNCDKLKLRRSLNKFYFSEVIFKHTSNPCDGNQTFLGGTISLDPTAANNFIRTNTLTICSEGMRDDKGADTISNITANRLLERYGSGAEFIDGIDILFSCACTLQVGDLVKLDLRNMNVSDTQSFCRDTFNRFFEVYSKQINYKTGAARINVIDTGINGASKLALVAPAIKDPIYSGNEITTDEFDKFCPNECVRVRTNDCTTYSQEFTVVSSADGLITLDGSIPAGLTDFLIEACDEPNMPDDYNQIFGSISADGSAEGYGLG